MAAQSTVLVVEDDVLFLDALEVTLKRSGYRVLTASDGDAAISVALHHKPDVALIDLLIPGKSGFLVTQHLKEQLCGQIFIVLMSGNLSPAHRDYGYAIGAERFLSKPFSTKELLETVETAFPLPVVSPIDQVTTSRPAAIPA